MKFSLSGLKQSHSGGSKIAHKYFKRFVLLLAIVLLVLVMFTIQQKQTTFSPKETLAIANDSSGKAQDVPSSVFGFSFASIRKKFRLPSVCCDESCRSAYAKHFQMPTMHPIPAIRHIIWVSETVSEYFAEQLRSWQRIHPDWTFVLWRDQDLEPFDATYFPGLLQKFKSLPKQIMRVDMIRYMLLFKYGGVYADLDYRLVRNLNEFRRFHAVITREPEAHSLQFLGMSWPVKPLANAAFMMCAPGHVFCRFVIEQLKSRSPKSVLSFAGPEGLTRIMDSYQSLFPYATNAMESVYVPPSFSFYSYRNNSMSTSGNSYVPVRFDRARSACNSLMSRGDTEAAHLRKIPNLIQYCKDVNNMDPITDKSQPVFAIHDMQKSSGYYSGPGKKLYTDKPMDIRRAISNLQFGRDWK